MSPTIDQLDLLVSRAREHGIALWVDADAKLQVHGAPGTRAEHVHAELREHRDKLAELLCGPRFRPRGAQERVPFLAFYQEAWSRTRDGIIDVSFTNNTHWLVEIHGELDVQLIENCVQRIVRKHPVLSVRVDDTGQHPTFVYGTPVRIEHATCECEGRDIRAQLEPQAAEIVWRPFRPDSEPLFRPFVVQSSGEHFVLGFVLHHIIGDALSVSFLSHELLHEYQSARAGVPNRIPAPSIHYSDYVLATNSWLESQAFEYRLRFWKKKLAGIEPCRLPADHLIEPNCLAEFCQFPFLLERAQTESLFAVARRFSVTPYFVLLAAQARTLSHMTGQEDLAFVTMHHGRDFPGGASMIGSLQTQMLIRIRVARHHSLEEVIATCNAAHREAARHRITFDIVRHLISEDALHWFPEFNCVIGSRTNGTEPAEGSSYRMTPRSQPPVRRREFPSFKLSYAGDPSKVFGGVDFCSSELDAGIVARFVKITHEAIDEIAAVPPTTRGAATLTAS